MMVSDVPELMLSVASLLANVIASRKVQISAEPFVQRTPSLGSVAVPVLSAVVLTKNVFPALGKVISGETLSALSTTSPLRASGLTEADKAATTVLDGRPLETTRAV